MRTLYCKPLASDKWDRLDERFNNLKEAKNYVNKEIKGAKVWIQHGIIYVRDICPDLCFQFILI